MYPKRNLLSAALASAIVATAGAAWAQPVHAQTPTTDPASQQVRDQADQSNDQQSDQQKTKQKAKQADQQTQREKQQQNAAKLGAIVVQGFASSVQNSIEIKRESDSIVEAVSAEQIGKLPGTSIADALGRLPGLAVQTVNGRPQVLTIHGLGPDFSTALINGKQQVSTSNNRDVQFDQYPASWFGSVVVHMTPSASLIGQGLSGTVDMHTIRPLSASKPRVAVNARYIWNGMEELAPGPGVDDDGYHVNGVWVDQFANHTFGVTLGIDLEASPTQIQHQAPWGYPTDANGDLVVGGSKNYGISDMMKRQGYLATFQWRPNDHFTSILDLTYDHFKETQQAKGMEMPLFWGAGVTLDPGNVENGFVQSGTYHNVKTVVRNDYNRTRAKVWNIDWSNLIRFNADWSAAVSANYSRAIRHDKLLESYSGTGYGVGNGATDTVGFRELDDGMLYLDPSYDYTSGLVLTDPQGWGAGATPPVVQAGFINEPNTDDHLWDVRASVKRSFISGPISSVEVGLDRATRNKAYKIDQYFLILPNGAETAPIPQYRIGDPLAWMGIGPQVLYNPLDLIANGTLLLYPTALSSIAVPPNWEVNERDVTSYVQANLNTYLGGVSLRGNFGVQVAHTTQFSSGQYAAASAGGTNGSNVELKPTSGGTSWTRWLPSANLVFGFTRTDDLRVSAARTMARPRLDQMSASIGLNTDITHLSSTDPNQAYFSASGGNPALLPTMAENYNVSYEHYFTGGGSGYECTSAESRQSPLCMGGGSNAGYFAASLYFLSLSDYIDPNAAYLRDFSAFVDAYLTPEQQQRLGTTLGVVSGPVNDGHGYVRGAQLTLNLPLSHLTHYLTGFGTILTTNYTESSLVYGDNPNPITVPGLSEWVNHATLYYQHRGFQARVSRSYRSDFLGRVSGISATRDTQYLQGGSTYSAQVSYTFQGGTFDGLTLVLQGSNLTDKTFVTYENGDPRRVRSWERYGRRYELGISYAFE